MPSPVAVVVAISAIVESRSRAIRVDLASGVIVVGVRAVVGVGAVREVAIVDCNCPAGVE